MVNDLESVLEKEHEENEENHVYDYRDEPGVEQPHEEEAAGVEEAETHHEEFEAFLLEILSDFQVSIPEIGTLKATQKPMVIITSNRTRDIHDALKRRCFYHWIDYPDLDKEMKIIHARVPKLEESLIHQIAIFMQNIRKEDLMKRPGVSETLDWAEAGVRWSQCRR